MIKQFYKPTSLEEALMLKEKFENSATWFAGGTHINHADFKASYDKVISLEGLGLHYINSRDKHTSVGASVTLQKLIDNGLIPEPLRKAAATGTPRSIRNMATIGGDIAAGGQLTMLTPCLIALKTMVQTADKQTRPLEEYLQAEEKQLIVKIILPLSDSCCRIDTYSYQSNGPILVNVAASIPKAEDGQIDSPKIVLGKIEAVPRRLTDIEKLIRDKSTLDRKELETAIADSVNPIEDHLGSLAFKKYIAATTVSNCILSCMERG
jgi:putative selenate reductase FAD-binding subunit